MNISSKFRIFSALVLAIALGAAHVHAEAASSGGAAADAQASKPIVIVSIIAPSTAKHAVEATKIEVSRDKKTVTITIRDPECPNQTSTMTVNVATQAITGHTGEPCHSYVGWKVRGYARIKK